MGLNKAHGPSDPSSTLVPTDESAVQGTRPELSTPGPPSPYPFRFDSWGKDTSWHLVVSFQGGIGQLWELSLLKEVRVTSLSTNLE